MRTAREFSIVTRALRKIHRDASSILNEQVVEIIDAWAERVRQQVASSEAQDVATLRNAFPRFIQSLTNVISTTRSSMDGERFINENKENCRRHGAERARIPQYTLEEVIEEYKILRQVIFDYLERERELRTHERDKLLDAIDSGISEAATEFAAIRGFPASRISRAEEDRKIAIDEAATSHLNAERSRSIVERLEVEGDLRERFVSALSHDLRTPLTAAKMSAQLIVRQADDAETVRRIAGRIINSIDRADQMIQDMLDAKRIRAGEPLQLAVEQMDLVVLAREVLRDLAGIHGDRFILESDPALVGHWSAKDLRRVVENLAVNAVKYGDPHGPVTVKVFSRDEKAVLSVHNEGNPIPLEVQAELFQQYHRANAAQRGGQKGWGLGLTLVRGIAEAHEGTVRLESDPTRGTTFIVELPRKS